MKRVKTLRVQKFALLTVIVLSSAFLASTPQPLTSKFAILTFAVSAPEISLPLQLVFAYGLQIQVTKEAIGYPWWTLGGFGVTFVVDKNDAEKLKNEISQVCRKREWDPLTARQARLLSSQQIRNWMREPLELMMWRARTAAIAGLAATIDPEQAERVSLDDIAEALSKLPRRELPILLYDPETQSWSHNIEPAKPIVLRQGFRLTFRLPSSQRSHGLWWLVANGNLTVGMVVGELLGGGTGAKWFQLLRGDKPLAYHAIAQVQWTPIGSELTLYAATMQEDLKLVRQRAQGLLADLRSGKVDGSDFERAKSLAELRLSQITADPILLNRTVAVWLMSGRSLAEWEGIRERMSSLTPADLLAFCRSLPSATEVIAVP